MSNHTEKDTDRPSRRDFWHQFSNSELLTIFSRVVPADIRARYESISRAEAAGLIDYWTKEQEK